MIGKFVISKAGHDKDKVYMVVDQDLKYCYLVDGKYKCLKNPKKKSLKHIQVIQYYCDKEVQKCLVKKETVFDEQIKYAIDKYWKQRFIK